MWFAGAVDADQAEVAARDLERNVVQHAGAAIVLGNA